MRWAIEAAGMRGALACATLLAATVALWPSSAAATENEIVPATVETARWEVARPARNTPPPVEGRTVTIRVGSGYCIGEPKPRIHHVKIVERPRTAQRPFKSTVLTVYVIHPEYERPVPPPDTDHVSYNVCAGLGFDLVKRVKLKRPVAGLRLFDGSFSPPRKAWPRS